MPYFPEHNVLFIHIPKNAGRSIEAALLPDELTPDSGRRNLINRASHSLQIATASKAPRSHLLGTLDAVLVAQHLTYQEIELLGLLPKSVLNTVDTFSVVRNPFDRMLSSLRHFSKRFSAKYSLETPKDIERAISVWRDLDPADHNLRAHRRPQVDYVRSSSGKITVKEILRFETLEQDFKRLREQLSISPGELPWIGNTPSSRDPRSYSEAYTTAARKSVSSIYEADLDAFCYAF